MLLEAVSEIESDPSVRKTCPVSFNDEPSIVAKPAIGVWREPSNSARNALSAFNCCAVSSWWIFLSISAVFLSAFRHSDEETYGKKSCLGGTLAFPTEQ